MRNLMIDLETMGTRFDAPVVAVGAVFFDPESGELGDQFYRVVDLEDACLHGKPLGGTIKWWMAQGDDARAALLRPGERLAEVLSSFAEFIRSCDVGDSVCVWGNGATFDISILEYAFMKATGRPAPWKFWNIRDCRTIKELGQQIGIKEGIREGVAHNALDDAIHQARWVSAMWKALLSKGPAVTDPLIG